MSEPPQPADKLAFVRYLTTSALAALVLTLFAALAAAWPATPTADAAGGSEQRRPVELDGATGAARLPLAATAGETWRLRVEGALGRTGLSVVDPRSGAIAAQTANAAAGLRWSAPQTGIWRIEIRSAGQTQRQTVTLVAARASDIGGGPGRPVLVALNGRSPAIAQGAIDWPGDEDWFAVGMSAADSYTIYTVLGDLGATRGEVLLPGAAAPTPLGVHANGKTLYSELSPDRDGVARIRIFGTPGGVGAYALGVTPRVGARHPQPTEAAREEHQLLGAQGTAEPGELVVNLRGDWGAIDDQRRVGVWLDSDADGDWDQIAVTRDGWRSRVWSIAERRWLEGGAWLGSSGFDSLILRIPTRGFAAQVRWRAAVRHSTDGWRSASDASGLVEPRPPLPQRSTLWPIRQPSGTPRQRQAALDAAGVGGQRPGQPVVALDPGHGGEQTGPSFNGVVESHSNLALAREIAARLEAAGVYVVLTRDGDTLARLNFSGAPGRADLHARIELAHLADADLFVSLHSNAAHNDWQRGLEAWYFPSPDGSGANRALAQWILDAIAASLAQWGYDAPTIAYDSSCWEILEGHCDPLYVIAPFLLLDRQAALDWGLNPEAMELSGDPWAPPLPLRYPTGWTYTRGVGPIDLVDPQRPEGQAGGQAGPASVARGTMMPAVLLELLYMTHRSDAAVLRSEAGRAAIAEGVAQGILSWLRRGGRLPSQ